MLKLVVSLLTLSLSVKAINGKCQALVLGGDLTRVHSRQVRSKA